MPTCPIIICGAGWRAHRGRLTPNRSESKPNTLLYQLQKRYNEVIANYYIYQSETRSHNCGIAPIPARVISISPLATFRAAHGAFILCPSRWDNQGVRTLAFAPASYWDRGTTLRPYSARPVSSAVLPRLPTLLSVIVYCTASMAEWLKER